jgi:iron complex transport system permease protein
VKSRRRIILIIIVLVVVLIGVMLLATAFGGVSIAPLDIVKMSLNKLPFFHFDPTWRAVDESIIFHMRLPCVVGVTLVGAALATAGGLFQGLLRNPLADPYIIGTSSGALLGVTIAMVFLPATLSFSGFGAISMAAFLGALSSVFLVYSLARIGGRTHIVTLILAGVAVSFLFTAIAWFLLDVMGALHHKAPAVYGFLWGQVEGVDWAQLTVLAPIIFIGIIAAMFFASHLNAFSLGEEGAAYLGINVERDRVSILALGALLTACAVCIGGLIGFVGLVIPHVIRLIFGPDHRFLLPASALAGASFLVLADLFARTILAPTVLKLGILTALIGGPLFLYLLIRYRKEYAF